MSTRLLQENGTTYPVTEVFSGGILNETALAEYGVPKLTSTFAFAMFMANAAVCSSNLLASGKRLMAVVDRCTGSPLLPILGR